MDDFAPFDDLPQIQLPADGHFLDTYRWSDRDAPWIGARPNQRAVDLFGSEVALDTAPAMSNMQRYLSGSERALFQTNTTFQLDSRSDRESRRFDFDPQYEPQAPWPCPEKQLRQRSPDYRSNWSVSSTSTYNHSHQDDLSTAGFGSSDAGSSPGDYASQDTTYSDYKVFPAYSLEHETVGAGASCTLQEIQHYPSAAEDVEPPMEHDDYPDMKMGYACEQETIFFHGKMEPDDHRCAHVQDDDAVRMRDAESVKPVIKTEDDADSDYSPHTSKRRRRRGSQSSASSKGSGRHNSNARKVSYPGNDKGRVSKRTKASSSPKDSNPMNRPFPCPFAGYSCQATFASKNEWKRHVSTQHIRLGFWRCQLCPSSVDGGATTSYNDFNRKDLFAQHLRRMHMAPSSSSGHKGARTPPSKENPITEDNMSDFQAKCHQKLRDAPPSSSCLFCNRTFEGHGSWEERMEHVGRHFEKDKKGDASMYGIEQWREDSTLEEWLCREGLIELDDRGLWHLGDGAPKRAVSGELPTLRRRNDVDSDVSADD